MVAFRKTVLLAPTKNTWLRHLLGIGPWLVLSIFVGTLILVFASHVYVETKRRDLVGARQALALALQEKAVRDAKTQRSAAVQRMLKSAASMGLAYALWDERRLNIKQAVMSRDKAGDLMTQVRRSKNSVFGADQFEISVRGTEQSLFLPEPKGSELLVTLSGSMLFSRQN